MTTEFACSPLRAHNIFVIVSAWSSRSPIYFSEAVQEQILELPDGLAARYIVLMRRMVALGPNLGEPHTKACKRPADPPVISC
jgi:hypothetical protein